MYFSSSLVAAALVAFAQAQNVVPSGFAPAAKAKLEVFFNSTMVMTPGQLMTKAGKLRPQQRSSTPSNTPQKPQANLKSLFPAPWRT
jgi:hypothetical protein